MEWEVQLIGDKFDLQELSKTLKDPDLRIVERGNQYFLESIRFGQLTKLEDVRSVASEMLQILTGATRLSLGGKTPLQIAGIARVRDDGSRDLFVAVSETILVRETLNVQLNRSDGTIATSNPADEVPEMVNLGLSDTNVAKSLRLFGATEHDWTSLYRLFEVIEDDVGGIDKIVSHGWATKSKLRLFKHTSNSPGAVGDEARHGKETSEPPLWPMGLGEARALIEFIMHNWLRTKMHP